MWFKLLANAARADARKLLDKITAKMTPQEIDLGEQLVKEWRLVYPEDPLDGPIVDSILM